MAPNTVRKAVWAQLALVVIVAGVITPTARADGPVVATVAISQPEALVVSPTGADVYVTDRAGNVNRIDAATNTVLATAQVGSQPWWMSISPDGTRLYVSSDTSVHVVDSTTLATIATIPVQSTIESMVTAPDGSLWIGGTSKSLIVVDPTTGANLAQIPIAAEATSLAFTADGRRVYATSRWTPHLIVVDVASRTVAAHISLGKGRYASRVAVNPATGIAYASISTVNEIVGIDPTTLAVTIHMTTGNDPVALVVSPDGSRIYETNVGYNSNDRTAGRVLYALDTATGHVLGKAIVGPVPWYLATNPAGTRAYVSNTGGSGSLAPDTGVSVLDLNALLPATTPDPLSQAAILETTPAFTSVQEQMTSIIRGNFTYGSDGGVEVVPTPHLGDVIQSGPTSRMHSYTQSSTSVVYLEKGTLCTRRTSRKYPDTMAADRQAKWKCRKRKASDEDARTYVSGNLPSATLTNRFGRYLIDATDTQYPVTIGGSLTYSFLTDPTFPADEGFQFSLDGTGIRGSGWRSDPNSGGSEFEFILSTKAVPKLPRIAALARK